MLISMRNFFIVAISLAPLALLSSSASAKPAVKKAVESFDFTGNWVMHFYIGTRVFDDQVSVTAQPNGSLGGSLTVPGRFTTAIENVKVKGRSFAFDITADEGQGPFSVHYEGHFHGTEETFIGFGTILGEGGGLLGGFVGSRKI